MGRFNAGLYIDVKNNDGKLLIHSSIQSDITKNNFIKNTKSALYLLVGRKHEQEIKTINQVIFEGNKSNKYKIKTDNFVVTYWYMKN